MDVIIDVTILDLLIRSQLYGRRTIMILRFHLSPHMRILKKQSEMNVREYLIEQSPILFLEKRPQKFK